MTEAPSAAGRPVTVYVIAQVAGVCCALGLGLALLRASLPVWWAAACWLPVSAALSRKRSPSEALGSALQVGGVAALVVPVVPSVAAAVERSDLGAVAVARDLFGPALLLTVVAGVAFVAGRLLKRRAERRRTRRARKGVYRSG